MRRPRPKKLGYKLKRGLCLLIDDKHGVVCRGDKFEDRNDDLWAIPLGRFMAVVKPANEEAGWDTEGMKRAKP